MISLTFPGEPLLLVHQNMGNNTSWENIPFFSASQSNSEIHPVKKQTNLFYMHDLFTCCPAGLKLYMQNAVLYMIT